MILSIKVSFAWVISRKGAASAGASCVIGCSVHGMRMQWTPAAMQTLYYRVHGCLYMRSSALEIMQGFCTLIMRGFNKRLCPLKTSKITCAFSDECGTQCPLLCHQCLCQCSPSMRLISMTQQSQAPPQESTGFHFYTHIAAGGHPTACSALLCCEIVSLMTKVSCASWPHIPLLEQRSCRYRL